MKLIDSLRRVQKEHWLDALSWLFWSLIGGLLPTWGLLCFLVLFNQVFDLNVFTQNGEFALYSAAMLSASMYVVTKEDIRGLVRHIREALSGREEWKGLKGSFPGQNVFLLFGFFFIIFSTLLFSGATFVQLKGVSLPLNMPFLKWTSLGAFILSIVVSYIITVLDNSVSDPSEEEFRSMARAPAEELEEKFDEVRKGQRNE
jgi:hypothetical protein